MRFKSGTRGLKRKRNKENVFCKLQSLFIFLFCFHYSFSSALQKRFLELEGPFP